MDSSGYRFEDLVDLGELRLLFNQFWRITSFPVGIRDHVTGETLVPGVGWRAVCTLHRSHLEASRFCRESNGRLAQGLTAPGQVNIERCGNGLIDGATPVIIDGRHWANILTGQVLFSPPDFDFFHAQAERYGLDPESYLEAIRQVPVVNEEEFRLALGYLSSLATMIAANGLARLQVEAKREELQQEITERRQIEEELTRYRDHLEQQIDRRTAELLQSNLQLTREITEHRRAEEALQQEKNKMEAVLAALDDGLTVQDTDFRILYQNDAHRDNQGDHRGEHCYRAYHGRDAVCDDCQLAACFQDGKVHRRETTAITARGGMHIEVSASPIRDAAGKIVAGVEVVRDVTELKLLAARYQHAQKMEAIGTLAGGIAHDFNNMLTGILGYAQLSLLETAPDSPLREHIEEIARTAKRSANLVRQILTFSRRTEQVRRPVQLQPVITEALTLLRETLPATIEIRQEIDPGCGPVMADPTQIHQVLMNLCTNAYQAMRDGGLLEVGLELRQVGQEAAAGQPGLTPGPFACLTVRDSGHGMDKATMARIFEPYFTTKKQDEGTGLGLAVVHGIVKGAGGAILVESAPGRGTTFQVLLPLLPRLTARESLPEAASLPRLRSRVLFVDDEELVARLGGRLLEKLGCEVQVLTDSRQALEAFRAAPDRFDLVVTDQTMPGMTGEELSRQLLAIRPGLPIVLTTGFSETMDEEHARQIGIRELFLKPFNLDEFAAVLSRALGRPGPAVKS
ncbi:MAG: PocR ligand-binding domain-containing protein [Desulfobacteraceae bacterium]|nr:PocR ligand-binding domain-containing protein [Desulfobacteraceae bacterium]